MAGENLLPQIAEGVGAAGLFLYLMRQAFSADRPISRALKEQQKRLDAERERGDNMDTQNDQLRELLRAARDREAAAEVEARNTKAELAVSRQLQERFANENAELYAEIRRLKGGKS